MTDSVPLTFGSVIDEGHLRAWRGVCFRWFKEEGDVGAQQAMTFFDAYCGPSKPGGQSEELGGGFREFHSGDEDVVSVCIACNGTGKILSAVCGLCDGVGLFSDEALDEGLEAPDQPENVALLLQSAGLMDSQGRRVSLTEETYNAYANARKGARLEALREVEEQKRTDLVRLIDRYTTEPARIAARAAGDEPLLAGGHFSEVRPLIEAFVEVHGNTMGVHPFLKALRGLLFGQLRDPMVWQWSFPEDVLLEGDQAFTEDAVALLAQTLEYVPRSIAALGHAEEGATDRLYWEVAAHTSDIHIRNFLRQLPDESSLEGDPTGDLSRTEQPRTNMGGELDQDNECALRRLMRCRCSIL